MDQLKYFLVTFLLAVPNGFLSDIPFIKPYQSDPYRNECELTPQTPEGPFYVSPNIFRRNITEYRPGVPFKLTMTFTNAEHCTPLPGLFISIWQCDALGYYSHYTHVDPTITFPADIDHATPTDESTFLRGVQTTNKNGRVTFDTVVPGKKNRIPSLTSLKNLIHRFPFSLTTKLITRLQFLVIKKFQKVP